MLLLTYVKKGENIMSIHYAILGLLSDKPLTGYDMKKLIQDSPFMPWSGNNNQVYKALMELNNEGFVTNEIYHQDRSPSKKIYTITNDGLKELKNWLRSPPMLPEFKKNFLLQLAWSEYLEDEELELMLTSYELDLERMILLEQERSLGYYSPSRNKREKIIWDSIYKNMIKSYENELVWLKELREELTQTLAPDKEIYSSSKNKLNTIKEENKMNYQVVTENNKKYVSITSPGRIIQTEQDGLDMIGICFENDANLVLIYEGLLSDDFLTLRTGLAGTILQKLINYNIKAAAIINEDKFNVRFKELVREYNKGTTFRVFNNAEEAKNWLLSSY
jgi:PadR family transcriptional regulator, regulatory protein AphA